MTKRVLFASLLVACSAPSVKQVAMVDAPPQDAAPSPSPPPETKAEPALPPPGTWEVAVEDRSSTCAADAGGPVLAHAPPKIGTRDNPVFIPNHPTKDGSVIANIPLIMAPTFAIGRSDLKLEVGHVHAWTSRPDKSCGFEIKNESEFKEITDTKMVLEMRAEYGDATGCRFKAPQTSCKTDRLITFTLVTKFCEPGCVFDQKGPLALTDASAPRRCACPDAGAL